ncbi:hypothetical protein L1887_56522 [Cichorium endivia]|nr:hypothetical protein L1887_56522 [Cichorium endivia]
MQPSPRTRVKADPRVRRRTSPAKPTLVVARAGNMLRRALRKAAKLREAARHSSKTKVQDQRRFKAVRPRRRRPPRLHAAVPLPTGIRKTPTRFSHRRLNKPGTSFGLGRAHISQSNVTPEKDGNRKRSRSQSDSSGDFITDLSISPASSGVGNSKALNFPPLGWDFFLPCSELRQGPRKARRSSTPSSIAPISDTITGNIPFNTSRWVAKRYISERSIKKKSGPTHPYSRRATQLARVAHRKDKLNTAKAIRGRSSNAKVDRLSTLILMLPDELDALPDLAAVHAFVADTFLTRHEDELQELKAERRPGRPPHKRELEIKELMAKENQEYLEGFELPDLTSATNVKLLRDWQGDPQALPLFRMVRISARYPEQSKLMHPGNHKLLQLELKQQQDATSADAAADMETTTSDSQDTSSFQRVGEFAQMG